MKNLKKLSICFVVSLACCVGSPVTQQLHTKEPAVNRCDELLHAARIIQSNFLKNAETNPEILDSNIKFMGGRCKDNKLIVHYRAMTVAQPQELKNRGIAIRGIYDITLLIKVNEKGDITKPETQKVSVQSLTAMEVH